MVLGVQCCTTSVAAGASLAALAALTACSGTSPPPQAPAVSWQTTSAAPTPAVPVRPAAVASAAAPAITTAPGPVPRVKGGYKVGNPYVVAGVTYVPMEDPGYDKVGMASWYGPDFHGKQTANGELFDMSALTAAHPTLPMPSYAWVTNLRNGRTILVRINDRGPYKPGRIVDVSRASARMLGFEGQGVAEVRVRYAGRAPLDPSDDRRERQHIIAQPWSRGSAPPYGLGMGGGKLAADHTTAELAQ